MDKSKFMNNVKLSLRCGLGIDLKTPNTHVQKNTAKINELPLEFDGFIQIVDAGQQYDPPLKLTSSFKIS
jgi:hypothetical protein